jgi:hypothetical protein
VAIPTDATSPASKNILQSEGNCRAAFSHPLNHIFERIAIVIAITITIATSIAIAFKIASDFNFLNNRLSHRVISFWWDCEMTLDILRISPNVKFVWYNFLHQIIVLPFTHYKSMF